MSDRAEREKQLDWLYRLKSNLKIFIPKDFHLAEFEQSLDYAISSIKTDLKYDLLYEETTHIADADKMIEPTTKNCRSCRNFGTHHGICEICKDNKCWTEKEPTKNDLGVELISKSDVDRIIDCPYFRQADKLIQIMNLPPVTPQPKHGIWQQINKNEVNVIPEYKCSECGAEFKGFSFDFDYCPRCGSVMEDEE